MVLQCANVFSQWEQTNGPVGASYTQSVIHDTLSRSIYAGLYYSGVFKSDDFGESWTDISNGLTELSIRCLAVNAQGDLFTTGFSGIFRLAAGENAWVKMENELSDVHIASIAVNSQGDLFAAGFSIYESDQGGIFRSTDNGATWTNVLDDDALPDFITVVADQADRIWFGSTSSAFRSDDNGATWTDVTPLENAYYNVTSFAFAPGDTVFAGTLFMGGVFRSTDLGETWENVYELADLASVSDIEVSDDGSLFAANGSSLVKSEDGGNTWNIIVESISPSPFYTIQDLLIAGTDTIFAADYEVYRSVDAGTTFSEATEGMIGTAVNSVAVDTEGDVYATSSKIWKLAEGSENWEEINGNLQAFNYKDIKWYPDGLYVIADGFLYRSPDNGITWFSMNYNGQGIRADSYIADSLGNILISGSDGVFRSTDNGNSFQQLQFNAGSNSRMEINNGTILIYDQVAGLFRSTDNGESWTFISYLGSVSSFSAGDEGVYYAAGSSVWMSDDDGLTWQENSPEENGEFIDIYQLSNGNVYLASKGAIYISTDNGLTWQDDNTESASPVGFTSFASDPSSPWIYAGHSGRGVWRSSTVTGAAQIPGSENTIYPNPATSSITLKLENFSKNSDTRVNIYNSTGRLLKQIPVNSSQMQIDLSGIAPGIYLIAYEGKSWKVLKE